MDPLSSYFHRCATEVGSDGALLQDDFGMKPIGHMKARKKSNLVLLWFVNWHCTCLARI